MRPIDVGKIGLRAREMQVLRAAMYSRGAVPGGRYLCGTGQRRSAERLIERGFLTRAKVKMYPPQADWLVVRLSDRNLSALRRAERAATDGN
jgi:hypothetical protein